MDNWQKFLWRLESVANNKQNGGCEGVAIIEVGLFCAGGQLLGWSRPARIPLEPKGFDTTVFELQTFRSWLEVIHALKREKGIMIRKTLVVRNGEPVGWFREAVKLKVAA